MLIFTSNLLHYGNFFITFVKIQQKICFWRYFVRRNYFLSPLKILSIFKFLYLNFTIKETIYFHSIYLYLLSLKILYQGGHQGFKVLYRQQLCHLEDIIMLCDIIVILYGFFRFTGSTSI